MEMNETPSFPKYDIGSLAYFVGDLRTWVFRHKTEAARHFRLHHSTIGRYEKIDSEGGLKAPIGYLACLAVMCMDQQIKAGSAMPGMRDLILKELNRVIRSEYTQEKMPFRNWEELVAIADLYLEERKMANGQDSENADAYPESENRASRKIHDPVKTVIQVPPLPPQGVFGRKDELTKIAAFLSLKEREAENLSRVALRGMGGIGKTTLAIAFAHNFQTEFPDGVLWTSLGPKPTPRLLLDAWGRSLGMDLLPERDETACQNRLRQFLHDKQALIIIDDVWDTIQGGYFLVGGPYCRTLITTRELPIANNLATRERVLGVDVLKPESALELLHKLAPETANVDKAISIRLCERLEFLPLAITLAGRMLANEADVPQRMQRLVGELIERRDSRLQLVQMEGRQGLDEENPVSLQAILGMSVDRLDKPDQERFAMLSVFGGEPLTWEMNAVSAVWESSMEETEATISRFIQRGLVEPRDGRYWMHALLADYAAELKKQMGL